MNTRNRAQVSRQVSVAGLGMFAVCLALAPIQVQAATGTWTGGSTTWNTAGNWTGVNTPPISGDSLIFDAAGAGGTTLNNDLTSGSFNIAGITINSGAPAYTIAGNAFALTGGIANNSTNLQTINDAFSMTAARTFTTVGGITLGGDITGTGGAIIKAGAGTLSLTGSSNGWTGNTTVNAGTLNLNGAFGGTIGTGASSVIGVGYANGTAGAVLNIGGGTFNAKELKVGYASTTTAGTGWLTMTGGNITIAAGSAAAWFVIGGEDSAPGNGLLGAGQVDLSGNSVSNMNSGLATPGVILGVRGGMGVLNISGTAALNSNTIFLGNKFSGGEDAKIRAYLTQSSGTVTLSDATYGLRYEGATGSQSVYNLNGGVLSTKLFTTGGTVTTTNEIFNFNGGTLKAGAASPTFMTGLSAAIIYAGGATIDDGGYAITIGQALKAPTLYGLGAVGTTLTPTAAGSGYVNPPNVTFTTPSGGLPATGTATINAAGQVTGIVITSPGSGYTSGQAVTVTLAGGGGGSGATFTSVTASTASSSGGLTKLGTGTLTLSGTNTYTGVTAVSNGVLRLTHNQALSAATDVYIAAGAGAKVKLDPGTNTIHRLYVDGVLRTKNKPVSIIELPTALDGSGYFLPTDGAPNGTIISFF